MKKNIEKHSKKVAITVYSQPSEATIELYKKMTIQNDNVNNLINFYSKKSLKKDFDKVFGISGLN